MNKSNLGFLALGASVGALSMYLLDPQLGRRRRATATDKTKHALNEVGKKTYRTAADLSNRAKGGILNAVGSLKSEIPADDLLMERVRSSIGQIMSESDDVEVVAKNGVVTLTGSVLEGTLSLILRTVAAVPGVEHVENRLRVAEFSAMLPRKRQLL